MPLNFIWQMIYAIFLVGVFISPVSVTAITPSPTTLTIDQNTQFLSADGTKVIIEPGTYEVEAADPWLRLIPAERRNALLLEATGIYHEANISSPTIRRRDEGTKFVVQLLLPDGQGLEAVGTESRMRSRAVKRSRLAKATTRRKSVSRPLVNKSTRTHSSSKTMQQLEQQVQDLQRLVHALQNRLSKLETAVQVSNSGVTISSSVKIKLNASTVEMSSGMVKVNSGMSKFTGVVKSDTVVTNSVVSSSYTPGAGNIW